MDAVTTQTMQTTIFYPIVDVVVMSQQIILSYFLGVPKTKTENGLNENGNSKDWFLC